MESGPTENALIRSLIDAIEQAKARAGATHSEAHYRSILRELGYSDDDFAAFDAYIDTRLRKGRNLMRHGVPDRATEELQRAHDHAPWRPDIAHDLAMALVDRARIQTRSMESRIHDASTAMRLSDHVLEVDPDHPAAAGVLRAAQDVLSSLHNAMADHALSVQREERQNMITGAKYVGGAVGVVVGGVLLYLYWPIVVAAGVLMVVLGMCLS